VAVERRAARQRRGNKPTARAVRARQPRRAEIAAALPFWVSYMDLLQPRLGAEVEWASDEFFGQRERLIRPEAPVWREGVYDDHGKWMDGWETRRRRDGGHDSCVIRLCARSVVHGVDVDTTFFNGNQPVAATIEAWDGVGLAHGGSGWGGSPPPDAKWWVLLPESPLGPSAHHRLETVSDRPCTHLRLHIFPDGGVARLRAYGEVVPDWSRIDTKEILDLVAFENGGQALCCNDQHFGSMHNLLLPGRGEDMGDGWETRRRRGPGHDFVILRLGRPGTIERVEIDTAHFKGNYPDRALLRAATLRGEEGDIGKLAVESERWPVLLDSQKLAADHVHSFATEIAERGAVTHVRLEIHPDGGVSRLRLWGRLAEPEPAAQRRSAEAKLRRRVSR
jgi:allantoicase